MVKRLLLVSSLLVLFGANSLGADDLPTLKISMGVGLLSLDPIEAEDYATIRVLMSLGEGLTSLDKNLNPIEGTASWKWTKKNNTYIFSIKNRRWSDKSTLIADDFIRTFKRAFNPKTKAKLAFPLIEVIKNGKEFKSGKLTDWNDVGIKKIDDTHISIELLRPTPHVLKLLALPFAFPTKQEGALLVRGPSIGPMILEELKPEQWVLLKPNPESPNAPLFKIRFMGISETSIATNLFEKKELDIVDGLSGPDVLKFEKSPFLKNAPFLATYYLGFNVKDPIFSNLETRKIFAANIDRKDLASLIKPKQNAADSFVPTPLEGSNYTSEKARAKESSLPSPLSKNQIIHFYFDQQEKNNLIAERLSFLLKKNLGVTLKLDSFEWKTYLSKLFQDKPGFFRFAWLAPFADPLAHLQVFYSTSPNNPSSYSNPKYDALVDKIAATEPGKSRTKLVLDAQQVLLQDDVVIIPIYHYTQYYLLSDRWQGADLTPMGILFPFRARQKPAHETNL